MSRRKTDFLSLSFLDVLTSGLGAVIFLFIIAPKGTITPPPTIAAAIYMDSTSGNVWGVSKRSGWASGDTMTVVISEFTRLDTGFYQKNNPLDGAIQKQLLTTLKGLNRTYANTKQSNPMNNNLLNAFSPTVNVQIIERRDTIINRSSVRASIPVNQVLTNVSPLRLRERDTGMVQKEDIKQTPTTPPSPPNMVRPSNPCKVAFELKWASLVDNVDLYVYRGSQYVCGQGGLRTHKSIGEWDSGKSRNRIFGSDLRTNQEAVRQFDSIVAGQYRLYAHFKESSRQESAARTNLTGLIYTNNEKGAEKSESFVVNVPLSKKDKFLIGTVNLNADGTFTFVKKD